MAGRLPVAQARRIAEKTIPLSAAAAGFVDARLEAFAHELSLGRITRCVEAAISRHHPDLARRRVEDAAEHRGVWLEDDATDGTTQVTAMDSSREQAPVVLPAGRPDRGPGGNHPLRRVLLRRRCTRLHGGQAHPHRRGPRPSRPGTRSD